MIRSDILNVASLINKNNLVYQNNGYHLEMIKTFEKGRTIENIILVSKTIIQYSWLQKNGSTLIDKIW